jgi:hypothetical protein
MSPDPVRDFLLRDAEAVRIAAAVSEAWPAARGHIATSFLDRLEARLLRELHGWIAEERWDQFFIDRWPGFAVSKTTWASQYHLCLQPADYGGRVVFGIIRDQNNAIVAARPLSPDVLAAVQSVYPMARLRKPWWEAEVQMRAPAADWRSPDILWRMYTDETFLDAVADHLLTVARATEAILDRLATP